MALSTKAARRLAVDIGKKTEANEVIDAVNKGAAVAAQGAFVVPAVIVATNVSTTIDFGALALGDKVVHIPTVAGNASFLTVATAGTLPAAAVVGDLYVVLRAFAAPAASNVKF
jgi:hypothetical protein